MITKTMVSRMFKKKISIMLIALILLMQTVYAGGIFVANATGKNIAENILTSVTMTVYDINGQPVTGNVYDQDSEVRLDFTWALPNSTYENGSTYTFELPSVFELYNDITGELVTDDGSVGTFEATKSDHKVVMTFDDIENDFVSGTLSFKSVFKKLKVEDSTEQKISFPINGGYEISVFFKPTGAKAIEKKGISASLNAKTIDWEIIVNKDLKTVMNGTVTDKIPQGLAAPASVAVYELDINAVGEITKETPVDPTKYTYTNGDPLTVQFHGEIKKAYKIKYTTTITDASITTFKNQATFEGVAADATVTVNRGKHLDKSSSYGSNGRITWVIKYNYDERNNTDQTLTDLFDNSQKLVAGSIKVYSVTLKSDGSEDNKTKLTEGTDYTWSPETTAAKNGFKLVFAKPVSSAYNIEYQTEATDRITGNATISNTVSTATYKDTDTQNVYQVLLKKSMGSVDYKNKTVKWTVTVNSDSKLMTNALIKDTFTNKGLELIPDSIQVSPKKGSATADYEVLPSPLNVKDGFNVQFKEPITVPYTISYETKFMYDELLAGKTNFLNTAEVTWDEYTGTDPIKVVTEFDPNPETKANGFKYGSYNAAVKKVTWKIGVNYNGQPLSSIKLTDPVPADQKLDSDSIRVYYMDITTGGKKEDTTRRADQVPADRYEIVKDDSNKVFVKFNAPSHDPYLIEFETSVDKQIVSPNVSNEASVIYDNAPAAVKYSATVDIKHGGEYVYKDGQQDGDVINWSIAINRGQSTVQGAKIKDIPSDNQIFKPGTFHLFETTVDSAGNVKKAQPVSELTVNVDYKLEIKTDNNGNQTFELEFLHEIKKAYILEYQSLIVAANNDKVTNKVEFSGKNVQTVITPSTKEIIVKFSSGSGTGSGLRGALTIEKADELDNTKLLSGATFSLYRVSGSDRVLVNTLTTGSDGKIEFKKLLAGDYILKEVTAPAGYVLDAKDQPVTINSATPIKLTIENKKATPTPTPAVTPTPTPTSTTSVETPSPTPATPAPTTSVETQSPTPATPAPTTSVETQSPTPATPAPTTSVETPSPTPTSTTPAETVSPSPTPIPTKEPVTDQEETDEEIIIEEEEVPLGGKPSVDQTPKDESVVKDKDGADENFIDINKEDVPLGVTPPVKELPKTGEERHYYFEMAGLVLLLLGAVLLRSRFSRSK